MKQFPAFMSTISFINGVLYILSEHYLFILLNHITCRNFVGVHVSTL